MIRAILKSIYDRAKSPIVALVFAIVLAGCYTTVETTTEPVTVTYSYGYGYWWGWYGHYNPWIYYYPRPYIYPPVRVHVPSYYEKHPEYKSRDFGKTRQRNDVRNQLPPPKQDTKRPQGNRR